MYSFLVGDTRVDRAMNDREGGTIRDHREDNLLVDVRERYDQRGLGCGMNEEEGSQQWVAAVLYE